MIRYIAIVLLLSLCICGCRKEVIITKTATIPFKPFSSNNHYRIDTLLLAGVSDGVKNFYKVNNYQTVWINSKNRTALINFIKSIEPDGLLPETYNIANLENYELKTKTQRECIDYDIMLSVSFRKVAKHLFKGVLTARSVYRDWDLPAKKFNANKLLTQALSDNAVEQLLTKCRPEHPIYAGLQKSFVFINALPDDTSYPKISSVKPIVLNTSNSAVPAIKRRLAYWKDLKSADTTTIYDRKTFLAVKRFQSRNGIYNDGIINSKTIEALNITKSERLATVILNLERWKWFPRDFGEKAVVINLPDYLLTVVEKNKDTVDVYKVVIGKPERRTPVLVSKFNYLVINPTWTVPPTILKEDLIPDATEDRTYFANRNMKIYDWKNNEIAPDEWDPLTPDQYYYVQGPGPGNSLGAVKFNFNNSHTVYLHDTNHKQYFRRAHRALSSGCVRVQDPFRLATYLLQEEEDDGTEEKLNEMVASKETKKVFLTSTAYVHQLYWTAWMSSNGLQFRDDIYNLDDALYKKLRK